MLQTVALVQQLPGPLAATVLRDQIYERAIIMRKLLLSGVAIAALAAGPATAADMGTPAYKVSPPPAPPVYNWTGFYVGGGFGFGMWNAGTTAINAVTGTVLTTNSTNGGRGWLGMVTAGYDYQFNDHIVAGVFGEYDPSNVNGTLLTPTANNAFNVFSGQEKETSSWYVGGRIGWLVTPTLLSYWSGGYTEARFGAVTFTNAIPSAISGNTYQGWFLGGGLEYQVTFLPIRGLFFRSEYNYASYNSATLPMSNTVLLLPTPTALTIRPVVQTIMSGVTYKFNWTP
jgi:outer membrane immunogenic protein